MDVERCPHCSAAQPVLQKGPTLQTAAHSGDNTRVWVCYTCRTCGGVVLTESRDRSGGRISWMYPSADDVDDSIPGRAREYLRQAIASQHAPAGAVMLAASAVDAMLKEKGFEEGSLYSRIDKASEDHLITGEMARWAHEVRLDANDQRHSDDSVPIPRIGDAQRSIEFAKALAEFMFVLPAKVTAGRQRAEANDAEQ